MERIVEIKDKPIYYVNIAKVDGFSVHDIKIGLGTKKNFKKSTDADLDFYMLTSPQHLKALSLLISENVAAYERLFGEIKLQPDEKALKELDGKVEVVGK